jgi:hypothetical protein
LLVTDAGATSGPVGHSVKRIAVSGTAVGELRSVDVRLWYPADAAAKPRAVLLVAHTFNAVLTNNLSGNAVDYCTFATFTSPVGIRSLVALRTGFNVTAQNLLTYSAPISNDTVTIDFQQHIGPNEALRTGAYSKSLTLTLSTTRP